MDHILKLQHTLDALFGKGVSRHMPKDVEMTFSRKTGRIRTVMSGGRLLCTLRIDGGPGIKSVLCPDATGQQDVPGELCRGKFGGCPVCRRGTLGILPACGAVRQKRQGVCRYSCNLRRQGHCSGQGSSLIPDDRRFQAGRGSPDKA